jgi:Spy/CpxP family protein refolding chaperone
MTGMSLLAAWIALAPTTWAQQPMMQGGHDPMARLLYPPELVMQQQTSIGLRPEQRATITKAIQAFQTKTVDLQWRIQEQTQRLLGLLGRPTVDQAAVLTQVDEVLTAEREIKRAHLAMLIEIKNALTAEQQARLDQARGHHDPTPPPSPGTPAPLRPPL